MKKGKSLAKGLGLVRFMRAARSLLVDSVCTYDPKILRSFPFGQASRRSQWAHRSIQLLFAPWTIKPPVLPVPPSTLHPPLHSFHQFIGFLAANGYNPLLSREMCPHRVKNWLLIWYMPVTIWPRECRKTDDIFSFFGWCLFPPSLSFSLDSFSFTPSHSIALIPTFSFLSCPVSPFLPLPCAFPSSLPAFL